MKITLIGGGNVGESLAQRLAASPLISGIYWINKSRTHEARAEDIQQGLSMAPTCRFLDIGIGKDPAFFARAMEYSQITVLTAGLPLPSDEKNRDRLYPINCQGFLDEKSGLCELLAANKPRFLLVVTNPVDLMARFLFQQCDLDPARVVGLGTVVETARLRSGLMHFSSMVCGLELTHEDVWAYAIGTHNEFYVPVIPRVFSPKGTIGDADYRTICGCASEWAKDGATRVKTKGKSTLRQPCENCGSVVEIPQGKFTAYTIVESIMKVVDTVARDAYATLTVSVLDPEDPDQLFYSVPTVICGDGVASTSRDLLEACHLSKLAPGKEAMRQVLRDHPVAAR